jgi:predicted phosphodiesterase
MTKNFPQVSDTPIKRAIACIGDLHFSSIYSLMRPFTTFDHRLISPSPEQKQLNLVFNWCFEKMRYWKVDTILLCGDIIQGTNKKTFGNDLVTANLEEQRVMATEYLRPICKGRKIYGVSGTDYHQSLDTEIERAIINDLGGEYFGKMAWLTIPDSRRVLNLAHESAKATIYPFSAMEREATGMMKAYGEGKIPYRPDVIIRGHRHLFGHLHTSTYHFILVPSFQVWYPFRTAYYGNLQSDIGIVILFIDQQDRIIVHHYTKPTLDARIGDKTFSI